MHFEKYVSKKHSRPVTLHILKSTKMPTCIHIPINIQQLQNCPKQKFWSHK